MLTCTVRDKDKYRKYHFLKGFVPDNVVPVFKPSKRLEELFRQDSNLNNIPQREFDLYLSGVQSYLQLGGVKNFRISAEENMELLKHILIFRQLEAIPLFD